jgi:hypothetical protein
MHATLISVQPAVTTVRTAAAAGTSLTDSRVRRTNAELQRFTCLKLWIRETKSVHLRPPSLVDRRLKWFGCPSSMLVATSTKEEEVGAYQLCDHCLRSIRSSAKLFQYSKCPETTVFGASARREIQLLLKTPAWFSSYGGIWAAAAKPTNPWPCCAAASSCTCNGLVALAYYPVESESSKIIHGAKPRLGH